MTDSLQAPSVGLFPVSYVIGTGAAGAQRQELDLLIYTPGQSVRGTTQITQATNPPLNLHVDVWGTYSYLTVLPPSQSKILVTLQGNHGGPTANSPVIFKERLVLNVDWLTGVATYEYQVSPQEWISVGQVPAKREDSRVKESGAVDKQARLNSATLEAAIASGNAEHLKAIAGADVSQTLSHAIDSTKTASGKAGKSSRA